MQDERRRPFDQLPQQLRAVGPGWHPLLLRLHEGLRVHAADYRVDDLKEKFGTVRIQVSGVPDSAGGEIRVLLAAAEERSAVTCEFCGAAGRQRRRDDASLGWIKTVCDSCHCAWSQHAIMIVGGAVRSRPDRRTQT
ncbi:hypothetical protein [Streptomyces sp. NBC_01361]|uniref:hypothetical protein n=1 Tax=Streptomyces sp. NBC_01361 TaxID=2903838 RepID=UPI002E314718|nr:hypothetical protein [Streptomyces sp. NBC_01361]